MLHPLSETSPLVLVVDDHEDSREACELCLEAAGCRVHGAQDGVEAIIKARDLRPDILFMDLSLPGVDGWEATRILKSDPATRDIYIVALSGYGGKREVERATAAGVDEYVVKPLSPKCLTDIVASRAHRR